VDADTFISLAKTLLPGYVEKTQFTLEVQNWRKYAYGTEEYKNGIQIHVAISQITDKCHESSRFLYM
jgi:hypothetical protein